MRLVLVDRIDATRDNFSPLALNRPLWELRCGMRTLQEKLAARVNVNDVAYFVPPYMADAYRTRVEHPVNDMSALAGDDLILIDPLVKADSLTELKTKESEVGLDKQGRLLYARISKDDVRHLLAQVQAVPAKAGIESFIAEAVAGLPNVLCKLDTWTYIWDLVLANAEQITADFEEVAHSGIEAAVEQPSTIRGSSKDIYIAPGARVHPMVVIDAESGPVYIDQDAQIQPFSRIEGPCYIGKGAIILGAKCREGNTIGPACRIGGEVEASIIHGYSNKYHDGFIGHSYVGEWVNLGALTTNSDLKNDYSTVSVTLDGRRFINTGSPKVGALIGDHAKTSIGTLFNTGSYVGAMAVILTTGRLLPKFIPSFGWFVEGVVTKGFGKESLYETAKVAMSRRNCEWTAAEQAMWDAIFDLTAPARDKAIERGRRAWKCKT